MFFKSATSLPALGRLLSDILKKSNFEFPSGHQPLGGLATQMFVVTPSSSQGNFF
jgi:hypothetical protein